MILMQCACGQQMQVREEHAGSEVRCPACQQFLTVPGPAGPDPVQTRFQAGEPRAEAGLDREAFTDQAPRRTTAAPPPPIRREPGKGPNLWLVIGLPVGLVILVLGGGGLLVYLLISSSVSRVREAATRTQQLNNYKQVVLGLHTFHDTFRSFPAPGFSQDPALKGTKPLLSWRVAILPYIEEQQLYLQFHLNEPWDSPHNIQLLSRMPKIYAPLLPNPNEPNATHMQLITGPDTLFPTLQSRPNLIADCPDGSSNIFLIVEAGDPVPWTKPADVVYNPRGPLPKFGALLPQKFQAAIADGSCRTFDLNRISEATIRQAINPKDGAIMGLDWDR